MLNPSSTARAEPDADPAETGSRSLRVVGPPAPTPPAGYPRAPVGPVQPAAILRHKVQPPPLRTSTLSRQRLLDRLAWATTSRVTLVVADAGYGKSTLLADFSRRFDGIALWYSLQPDDLDWLALVPHLVAAAREVKPEFGSLTTSLLRAEPGIAPPKTAVISGLLSELDTLHDGRVVIIFDDVHSIEESPDANELLERLVNQAPPSFSFVFAGRRRPAIPLARWAGRGELIEITTDDLRFTREDTARLFADNYGQALDAEVIDELEARTQGWAACLQLFSTLISGLSPAGILTAARSLSGRTGAVFEYLAQEVVTKLAPDLQAFLTRVSLLERITAVHAHALFPSEPDDRITSWLHEAEAMGFLTRMSPASGGRKFHPLLREYLHSQLQSCYSSKDIAAFHGQVASAAEDDPLTACHHYLEAGLHGDAMRCLSSSTLQTLGSGLSGAASRLASRLQHQRPSGAVAVIVARRYLEVGQHSIAADLLAAIDLADEPPGVRAAIRHTILNLRWRMGESHAIHAVVAEILGDHETPALLRDIAATLRDGSSMSESPVPLPTLEARLRVMASIQREAGYGYYAAISMHNAAVSALHSGRLLEALELGAEALSTHQSLMVRPPEYYSTCSVLAQAALELGRKQQAAAYVAEALGSGEEESDVPAVLALLAAVTGDPSEARRLLASVEALERLGKVDISARVNAAAARGFLHLATRPEEALAILESAPTEFPFDVEADAVVAMRALALLLAGDGARSAELADARLPQVRARGSVLAEVRLRLVAALARENPEEMREAIDGAATVSELALLESADAIAFRLDIVGPLPSGLERSVERWPDRWLPVLRRVLDLGPDPRGVVAARLLDSYGELADVGRLRAYEKVYRRRTAVIGVGKALARRVSPPLIIHDLGQVSLSVGPRQIHLSEVRRRSSAVLMYLITRPNYTATREQLIEALWPDGDVASGSNSLNQSLYFLRREFDPWYEADVSVEYVSFASELVSLDRELVTADSVEFVRRSRAVMAGRIGPDATAELLDLYRGHFAADFEYEDWATSWRARVHAAFLDFARAALHQSAQSDMRRAADVALRTLGVDSDAREFESALVWIYWQLGARSAAETQYAHYAAAERSDGMTPPTLAHVVTRATPFGD